jgi:hypothetical protein
MSVISFDDSYVGASSVNGGGATTYTCPSNKRAEVLVTMSFFYIQTSGTAVVINPVMITYTFKLHLNPNDVLVFAESGTGSTGSISGTTIGCSFTKNTVTQESESLGVPTNARYSARQTYTVKEMLN